MHETPLPPDALVAVPDADAGAAAPAPGLDAAAEAASADPLPDTLPEASADQLPEALQDAAPDAVPDAVPHPLPDALPDRLPDALPAAAEPGPADELVLVPAPAVVARPPAVADLSPAACAALLASHFPALFGAGRVLPVKLRVQADIQARAPGVFSRRALSMFLHRHTTGTAYIRALLASPHRFDLDGQPAGEVAEEHRAAATIELERRRAIVEARRAAERDALRQAHRQAHADARTALPGSAAPRLPEPARALAAESGALAVHPPAALPQPGDAGATPRPPRPPRPPRGPGAQDRPRPPGQRPPPVRPGEEGSRQGPRPEQRPQQRPGQGPDERGAAAGVRPPRPPQPARDAAPRPERQPHPDRSPPRHAEPPAPALSAEQAAENEARRNRAALLRAYNESTLTRANFCVLKRISEAALEAQLTLARQEQPQRPRELRPEPPTPGPERQAEPGFGRGDRADRGAGRGPQGGRPGGPGRGSPRPDLRTDLTHPRPVRPAAAAPGVAAAVPPAAAPPAAPAADPAPAVKPD